MKEKIDLAFVVLHYMSFKDTIECVDSILKLKDGNNAIIIVDNCSPNNSGAELLKMYADVSNVHVILNDENVGFAKGNNIGIEYAKKHFNFEFVICLNSDTIMIQDSFYERVCETYNKYKFWALGPLIYTADGKYTSNPLKSHIANVQQLNQMIKRKQQELIYAKYRIMIIRDLWWKIKKVIIKYKEASPVRSLSFAVGIPIHGSCIVFSKLFFENLNGFDSRTFLYQEENILFHQINNANGIVVYDPNVVIYHKEDASVNSMNYKNSKKQVFMIENELKSLEVLKSVIEKEIISKES